MPGSPNKLSRFWQELKRRRVIHVIVVYATAAFVILELVNNVFEPLRLPEWTPTFVILILAIGFPLAIIFSWIFEISLKGLVKTKSIESIPVDKEPEKLLDKSDFSQNSIIVLPFMNISPDPDQEYFSDGITEEIITDLSHIHDLKVISRSSAMTLKGTRSTVKEIAEKVLVRYVLEGSVRKAGSDLRITAQLIDAETDTHLWAEKYNGKLDDVFDIQEKVSKAIVDALKIKLSPDAEIGLAKQRINDITAYEQYLLARHEIWRATKESLGRATQLLHSSMNAIGRKEFLLTALGYVYFQYVNLGIDPDERFLDLGDEMIDEALKLNPELSKAYFVKSALHETRGNLIDSFTAIKQAVKLDPADSEALIMIAFLYTMIGRPEKGMHYAVRAIEVDPLYPLAYTGEWWVYQSAGKFDRACETCAKMYEIDQDNLLSIHAYGYMLACNNKIEQATRLYDSMFAKHPGHALSILGKAFRHAIHNEKKEASDLINDQVKQAAEMDHVFASWLADVYSLIGETDKAINCLERVTREVYIDYPYFAKHDPFIENLREEERFNKLMAEVKVKWENFEV